VGESLPIQVSQTLHRRIGIRRGLEVGDEVVAVVPRSQAANSLVDLFADRPITEPAAGAEALIVAEDATTHGDRAIDVRARETGIHTDTPNLVPKLLAK
jgi:hypothetical protein